VKVLPEPEAIAYPVASIAFYGPNADFASKVAVGITARKARMSILWRALAAQEYGAFCKLGFLDILPPLEF